MSPRTAERFRDYLRHRGWVRGGVVVDAVIQPGEKRDLALQSLSLQARSGCLKTRGVKGRREYHFVRDPAPRCSAAIATRVALAKSRKSAREAEKARKAAERESNKRQRVAAKRLATIAKTSASNAKTRNERLALQALVAKHAAIMAKSRPVRKPEQQPQTVDDFLARGGRIEILPPFQMSERLSR